MVEIEKVDQIWEQLDLTPNAQQVDKILNEHRGDLLEDRIGFISTRADLEDLVNKDKQRGQEFESEGADGQDTGSFVERFRKNFQKHDSPLTSVVRELISIHNGYSSGLKAFRAMGDSPRFIDAIRESEEEDHAMYLNYPGNRERFRKYKESIKNIFDMIRDNEVLANADLDYATKASLAEFILVTHLLNQLEDYLPS